MGADFTLELRRLAGTDPRFAVRYSCRNGRAVLGRRPVWSVAEASLRSNGHAEGASAAELLQAVFVFVGFELADNGKFELWPHGERALLELPVAGTWVTVTPTPVQARPFFSLDTDELDFVRPWKGRLRGAHAPEPPTEPGISRSRWERPSVDELDESLLVDLGEESLEILPMPARAPAVAAPEEPAVGELKREIDDLQGELKAERSQTQKLLGQVHKLQAAVAALVSQVNRG